MTVQNLSNINPLLLHFSEYGVLLVGATCNNPETGEDVAIKLVDEGLAKVRDNCQKLKDVQEAATADVKGMWGGDNPRALEAKFGGKPIPAIVEHVRHGSTVSFPPA